MRGLTCLVLSTLSGSRLRATPRFELLLCWWHLRHDRTWFRVYICRCVE
jgi:hypothetical protein